MRRWVGEKVINERFLHRTFDLSGFCFVEGAYYMRGGGGFVEGAYCMRGGGGFVEGLI